MNEALIKLTEERIDSNEKLQTFVQKAKAVTIPLFPETVQFTDPALKFGAAVVTVDLQLDNYGNNRDVYRNESGGYCLHLSKLNEIAQQAGIQIIDSKIMERKVDEQGRVTFINHQVRGRMRSIDGSIKELVTTGKYDYFRDIESLGKGDPNNKQVKARRKHAEALAESNAITRLYNKLIAQIPTSFSLDELKKPFLIPYVIEDKDELLKGLPKEDQIEIKKLVVKKRLGLIDQVYSSGKEVAVEYLDDEDEPQNTDMPIRRIENEATMTAEEINRINAETFRDAPQKERTEKILALIELKGYKDPTGAPLTGKRIEKNTIDSQIRFIEKLLNLPDKSEELPL